MSDQDLQMPFGISFVPANVGAVYTRAASPSEHLSGFNVNLDPGPVHVAMSWDGEEKCELWRRRDGQLVQLAYVPSRSGGGVRSAAYATFGAIAGDQLYLYIRPGWSGVGNPTGTISVYPTPG
ncbi:hypothetical protein [Corynebacterium sp.]|uniref:hypothetical protein n=1 Tax=Corynebacterium sp. TaxID=1720 RepID=UPI0028B1BEE1|nr:hypothetical protein [Corynebacterium sp.]